MRRLRLIVGWAFVASAAGWGIIWIVAMYTGAPEHAPILWAGPIFGFLSLCFGVAFHPGDRPDDG